MSDTDKLKKADNRSVLRVGLAAIEQYNNRPRSGITALLGRLLRSETEQAISRAEDKGFESRTREYLEGLEALGLGTNWRKDDSLTVVHAGGALEGPEKISLEIHDLSKLLGFLRQFSPEDLKEDSRLRKNLEEMIKMFTRSMYQTQGESIIPSATPLLQEFRRLGLEEATSDIEAYWIQSTRGTLKVFIDLSNAQCFEPPDSGYFPPSKWHQDSNPENYEERWGRTKSTILEALKNKNAKSLIITALDNLITSAEVAIAEMENNLRGILTNSYIEEGDRTRIQTATHYKEMYEGIKKELAQTSEEKSLN